MQIRLLRLLQERTFEPLGSNRTQRANVRFISATHRNLLAEVAVGRFREDLFYRLKVVQINLPPLRERPEDIPLLARHFLDRLNRIHGRDVQGFSPDAMRCLIRHPWPGNIRELENALEHAFVLYRTGLIEPAHLPDSIRAANAGGRERRAGEGGQLLKDAQLDIVLEALRRHRGNQSAAARELGIHKTTLWRKLKLAGLKP
jgi:transcriptional regulator with PAS, ATPase and Fis domain